MSIIKIFRGNIATQLYSEKEIIKTKSKDLRTKKTQMKICKRDMEELALAESLVQIAKNQVYTLTQIEDFVNFIHSEENYQNIDIETLFDSINPDYDPNSDIYSNLFAQFDYALTNKDNVEYKNDSQEILSLKEWYPYLYQKASVEYYELYSEISVHQINIYKIANDTVGVVDIRRGEVDMLLSIAKNISENVNKLIDFTSQYLGTDSEQIKQIANDMTEQEEQVHTEYLSNIDEDDMTIPVTFDVQCNQLLANSKRLSVNYDDSVKIMVTSNVPGVFTINEQPTLNYVVTGYVNGENFEIIDANESNSNNVTPTSYNDIDNNQQSNIVSVVSNGVRHEFVIKNNCKSTTPNIIETINAKFTPTDTTHYSVHNNYNILTKNGDAIDNDKSNLLFDIEFQPLEITGIIEITWVDDSIPKYASQPNEQHYYVNVKYTTTNNVTLNNITEIDKDTIEAYSIVDSTLVNNFYITRGQYNLFCQLGAIRTQIPIVVTIQ